MSGCQVIFNCFSNPEACGYSGECPHFKNGYCNSDEKKISAILNQMRVLKKPPLQVGEVSDGYHTFNELYRHRYALFGALCRKYSLLSWKSKKQSDGGSIQGYFLAGIDLPVGQVSYHIPLAYWKEFPAEEVAVPPDFDGHTSEDVVDRLLSLWEEPETVLFMDTIKFFGKEPQIRKAIEELAELIRALAAVNDNACIDEEMADVYIMLSQLLLIFGNKSKVGDYIKKKKKRLYDRITGKHNSF